MTTAAQIKRLVKPFLARHDDLVQVGPWVYLKPVRHVAHAIVIDRTGQAKHFRPTWAVIHLVVPTDTFSLNWGERLFHPAGGLWDWNDPTIQEALIEVVEKKVFPLLRPIETLDHFVAFASSRERFPLGPFDLYLLKRVAVDVARGDMASARSACEELLSRRSRESRLLVRELLRERFEFITKTICPLISADDRDGLVKLLREWEAYSVRHLKLEGISERTPFPIELQMANVQGRF